MKNYLLYILLLSCLSVNSQQKKAVKVGNDSNNYALERYAFVVGNDHYTDPTINSLTSCRLDAERIVATLQSERGFNLAKNNTEILLDANKKHFVDRFKLFLQNIQNPEISTLYFYFSGHGIQGGLVPTDFKSDDLSTVVGYDWIREQIERSKVKAVVFVIDACYAGSFIQAKDVRDFNRAFNGILKTSNSSQEIITFTATNAYRITASGRHESLYTRHFLEAIHNNETDSNKDGIISSGELQAEIAAKLAISNSPQYAGNKTFPMASSINNTPLSKTPRHYGNSTSHDLIFWKKNMDSKQLTNQELNQEISKLQQDTMSIAKAKLGYLYRKGIGFEKNYHKALSYLIPAAMQKDGFAQYNLGIMYSKGNGFSQNTDKAIEYYLKAAAQDNAFAQHNLGTYYYNREGGKLNDNLIIAKSWFKKAAESGLNCSRVALGLLLEHEYITAKDPSTKNKLATLAVQYITKAAKSSDSYAQFLLATWLRDGKVVAVNLKQSEYWFKQACENNEYRACNALLATME